MRDTHPDLYTMQRICASAEEDGRGLSPDARNRFNAAAERFTHTRPALRDLTGPPQARLARFEHAAVEEDCSATFDRWLRFGTDPVDTFGIGPEVTSKDVRDWMKNSAVHDTGIFASGQEQRALGTIAGPAGGFAVPESFATQVVEAQKLTGGLASAGVTVINTDTGSDLPVPLSDGTGEVGGIVAENTADTESDPSYDTAILKSFAYTSRIVRVSLQLLQDAAFDVGAHLAKKLGVRIGRAQGPHWISGTGLQQPEGITLSPQVIVGVTASGTNTVTETEITNLRDSVDPAYRSVGTWVISPELETHLLNKRTAGVQHYPEMKAGKILDRPYAVDAELGTVTTGATPALFGDLSNYWIRRVKPITVLRLVERYAEFLEVGFIAFDRADGAFLAADAGPVKKLVLA